MSIYPKKPPPSGAAVLPSPPAPSQLPVWVSIPNGIGRTAEEHQAEVMETYAHTNIYYGPSFSGALSYCGWPLTELAKKALPHASSSEQAKAVSALRMKHTSLGTIIPPPNPPRPGPFQHSPEEMLHMRMRWLGGQWAVGFHHVAIHVVGDVVHLWVITKDAQSTVLEDEVSLYPSDALITKLNMLKQG